MPSWVCVIPWSAAETGRKGNGAPIEGMFDMSGSQFPAGSELGLNDAWTSDNERTVLRLQEDRNLVLYKDGGAAWQAPNAFGRGDHAIMQDDGNFVLYDEDNQSVWASDTSGNPGASLAIQDDGNAVVYGDLGPLWATNTGD